MKRLMALAATVAAGVGGYRLGEHVAEMSSADLMAWLVRRGYMQRRQFDDARRRWEHERLLGQTRR